MNIGKFAVCTCALIVLSVADFGQLQAQTSKYSVTVLKGLYKDGDAIPFIHILPQDYSSTATIRFGAGIDPKGRKSPRNIEIPISGGLGRKVLQTKDFVFRGEAFRSRLSYRLDGVGISDLPKRVFIQRETSLATASALTIDRNAFVVGEPITVKVDLKKIEGQINRFSNKIDGNLVLVMLPRQVSGGGWLPPVRYGFAALKAGQTEYTLWQPRKDDPASGANRQRLIPTGVYQIYYTWEGVILDQLKQTVTVAAPEPGDHKYITLTPKVTPKTKTALPVYDRLPKIGYRVPKGKRELVRNGHMALYRVGKNETLRLITELEILCTTASCSMDDDRLLKRLGEGGGWFKFGEQNTYPGTYEVRFYWRRKIDTLPYDDRQYVLDRKRFVITGKALAKPPGWGVPPGWEERAEVLPPDVVAIQSEKNSALEMGERVEFYIENTLAAAELGKDPWDAISADIWVSIHRKDGYGLSCGFFEEVPYGLPLLLKKSTFKPNRPTGFLRPSANNPAFSLPPQPVIGSFRPPEISVFKQPVIESIRPAKEYGFSALYSKKGRRNVLRLSKKRGDRHFNLVAPPVPGNYVVRLYRGKLEEGVLHAPNAEMLASYEFAVESKVFSRAVSFGNPVNYIPTATKGDVLIKTDLRHDANVYRRLRIQSHKSRSVVPGGAKTLPWSTATQTLHGVDGLRSVELKPSAIVQSDLVPTTDYAQLYLLNYGIVISESDPARMIRISNNGINGTISPVGWPDRLVPKPITYDDIKVPFEKWYMNDDLCRVDIVPEHEIRMVDWIPAPDTEKASYAGDEFDLVDGAKDKFPEMKKVFRGVPFYIEAVFKTPLDSTQYRGRIGKKTKVLFQKLDGNPLVYRSANMYVITERGLEILQ